MAHGDKSLNFSEQAEFLVEESNFLDECYAIVQAEGGKYTPGHFTIPADIAPERPLLFNGIKLLTTL